MERTVLLFGDSNTHGTMPMPDLGFSGRFGREERWAGRLAKLLSGWEVIAEGHPGRTTVHDDPVEGAHRNGLTVLPALLESHKPLDLVVIMLGTNDLKERFSVNAGDIAHSLERLARVVKVSDCGPEGRGPDVLLVAPPPIIEVGCLRGGGGGSWMGGRWSRSHPSTASTMMRRRIRRWRGRLRLQSGRNFPEHVGFALERRARGPQACGRRCQP